MSIERQHTRSRRQVGFYRFGPTIDAYQALTLRAYDARAVTEAELSAHARLSVLSAVVFTQRPEKMFQLVRDLEAHAPRLLNYGCKIIVRFLPPQPNSVGPGSLNPLKIITDLIARLQLPASSLPPIVLSGAFWQDNEPSPPFPRLELYSDQASWDQIANDLLDSQPLEPPNINLRITPPLLADALLDDERYLLQRAFHDAVEVHLVRMTDGRSGVRVYRAYAELLTTPNLNLSWPMPRFIKIGERKKILSEFDNYNLGVDNYVPFHLGPRLDKDRCCLGATKGLIVGDYVEASESLDDCAHTGRASAAISCLFDRTLHGWHRAAEKKTNTSVAAELAKKFPTIPPQRFARAQQLGATKTVDELKQIFDASPIGDVKIGVVHGDLHAQNILVRGNDAIVIDFLAQQTAPILFDMASLEASLMVGSWANTITPWSPADWLASVSPLYDTKPFQLFPPHASPKDPFAWFHDAVRQIRHHAARYECAPNQYAVALSFALLKKASKDAGVPEPESSARGIAYLLAEKILVNV